MSESNQYKAEVSNANKYQHTFEPLNSFSIDFFKLVLIQCFLPHFLICFYLLPPHTAFTTVLLFLIIFCVFGVLMCLCQAFLAAACQISHVGQ